MRLFWDMMRLRDAVAAVEGLYLPIGAVDDITDGLWDVSDRLLREALSEIERRRAGAGAGGIPDPDPDPDRLLDDARDRYRRAVGDRADAADPDLPAMAMALAQAIAQE